MHTIIHGTLCYWPLCSRLGRCPCSLSALRGEMPWKHIRQPFQLPCTDEGDLTWDLGAWNKTLEGRQLNCVVQQPFHIFKGRKAKSASHFTPRMAWGWSVPPSTIPGSSDGHGGGGTAVWSLPALGLRRAMGPKQGGSYSFFFSPCQLSRWPVGCQVQMLDHVVTLMYSGDQIKRNLAHEVLTKAPVGEIQWTHATVFYPGALIQNNLKPPFPLLEPPIAGFYWEVCITCTNRL